MEEMIKKHQELLARAEGVIFPYSERWVESHKDFAAKMWPNKLRRRNEAYIRWKFKGPLHGEVPGFLVAVVDGKVVGQLGLIPVKLWVDGKELEAQWACDLMVDTSIRQKGIGSLLLTVGMERNMVTLGSNPSNLAEISMTRLGFKPLSGPVSMLLPVDLQHFFGMVLKGRGSLINSLISTVVQPTWNLWLRAKLRQPRCQVKEGQCEDVIPLVAAHQSTIAQPHIIHDEAFLRWRYSVVFPANIVTLFTEAGSYAICEATSSFFYIYDWHISDLKDAREIFGRIIDLALQAKSTSILVYANTDSERQLLKKQGYLQMRTPVKVIYYPTGTFSERTNTFHYCIYDSDGNL